MESCGSEDLLILKKHFSKFSFEQAFSNWADFRVEMEEALTEAKNYLAKELSCPFDFAELAILNGCPAAVEGKRGEHLLTSNLCDCGKVIEFFVDMNSIKETGNSTFAVDVSATKTYELEPGDSGDCTRFYDVTLTWPIPFKLENVESKKKIVIVQLGLPSFCWGTSDSY